MVKSASSVRPARGRLGRPPRTRPMMSSKMLAPPAAPPPLAPPPNEPSRSERSMFSKPGSPKREAHSVALALGPAAAHPLERGMAMTVVQRPLLLVRQDVVGLLDFLELRFRRLVARIDVGMVLPCQRSIGLLDRLGRRVTSHPKDLVIIAFCHRATFPKWRARGTRGVASRSLL